MNQADISVLVGQFSQPGAAVNILTGFGIDPDIVNGFTITQINDIHPFQYVMAAFSLPDENIFVRGGGGKCIIQVQTAMAALFAVKVIHSFESVYMELIKNISFLPSEI